MSRPPSMGGAARVSITLAIYVVLAVLAWMAIPWIQRTFLLPPLFGTMSRGALVLGGPFAAALAWRYPEFGGTDPGAPEA